MNIVCPSCFVTNRLPEERLGDAPNCGKCRSALFRRRPLPVDGAQFRRMLAANSIPVIVDFWAPWCGPCRVFAPVYEEAAARLEPRARLIKLDTQSHPEAATPYGIRSIPSIVIFRNGQEVARQSGVLPLNHLLDWIESRLG